MNKNEIDIQLRRLKRHLLLAKTGDKIAFLDLAHCLRIISELKVQIDNLIRDSQIPIEWPNLNKNKNTKNILKGSKYFEIPLVSKKENSQQRIQIKGLHIINKALSANEIKELHLAGLPNERTVNLTFSQWLGSEVIYTTDKNNKRIGITREILVKRISNLLGGSHPNEDIDTPGEERFFDPYVKELHSIHVADDYPVTYYQLIEVAEIIIEKLDKISA